MILIANLSFGQYGYEYWPMRDVILKSTPEGVEVSKKLPTGTNIVYGSFAINDIDGNLLFYGCARKIFNAKDEVIYELASLNGDGIVIQNKINPNIFYYVFECTTKQKEQKYYFNLLVFDINKNKDNYINLVSKQSDKRIELIGVFDPDKNHPLLIARQEHFNLLLIYSISDTGISLMTQIDASSLDLDKLHYSNCYYNSQYNCFVSSYSENDLVIFDLDIINSTLTNIKVIPNIGRKICLTESNRYLYSIIEKSNNGELVRYKFGDILKNENPETFIITKFTTIVSDLTLKKGIDDNIYIAMPSSKTLAAIKYPDNEIPTFEENLFELKSSINTYYIFPRTYYIANEHTGSHSACLNSSTDYFIDNPVEGSKYVWNISPSAMGEVVSNSESYDKISVRWKNVGDAEISVYEVNSSGCNSDASSIEVKVLESPSAQFDNASLCYGEPLNVILSGVTPFTLDYTLDGEAFSVPDISTNIYRMPETPGKYSILKVSDKNCTSAPEKNNNAVIGKEMKPLKIKMTE